jgi:hypothetical protein
MYDGTRVRAGFLLRGYLQAFRRLQEAMNGSDTEPALRALFETLEWAVALDEVIAEIWRPEGRREGFEWRMRVSGASVMQAVRYVRNRVHHQWADALRLEVAPNRVLPFDACWWIWHDVDELPAPDENRPDARGRAAYVAMVADEPRVIYTLTYLQHAFAQVVDLLEPPRPRSLAA